MDKVKTSFKRIINDLSAAFSRISEFLLHPLSVYESGGIRQLDAAMVILLLMLITALQKTLWAAQTHVPITAYEVLRQVFLAILLGWGGLSSLFYFIGRLAKKDPDFTRLALLVAAAGLPLVLSTLLSVLVIAFCLVFGIGGNLDLWQQVHTVIGWAGLAAGWPGLFSAMALREGLKIKWPFALAICGVLLGLLIAGSLLPILMQ